MVIGWQVSDVRASHIAGAEISWKCLGGDTFLLAATVYRDCNGVALTASPFTLYSNSGKKSYNTTLSSGLDITPVCKKLCTRCQSLGCSFAFGIERYTQTATVILNDTSCKYKIGWGGTAARSGSITTLNQGNFYVEAEMNKCFKPCDNSPVFTGNPLLITCTNQCVVFQTGAVDKDVDNNGQADSLVYKLTQPLTAKDTPLAYTGSYNYKEPLRYYGAFGKPDLAWDPPKCQGFHLDSTNGNLMFKATKTDVSVIAVLVEEWRKDSAGIPRLIAKVTRDVKVAIIDCPDNKIPVISGINGTTNTSMNFCVDELRCFTINTYDLDLADSVSMDWNKSIPGATFTVEKGKKHPKGTFCWRPNQSQYRTYPYFFVVNIHDDACPQNGSTAKTFKFYIKPKPEANYTATVDKCGYVNFKAGNSGKVVIVKYTWVGAGGLCALNSRAVQKYYKEPGTYHYTLILESVDGCHYSYTDSVVIPPHGDIDLPRDTTVCYGSTFTITGKPKLGTPPYTYSWVNSVNTTNTLTTTIIQDTTFTLFMKDATGCISFDSTVVRSKQHPKPNIGDDKIRCVSGVTTVMLDAHITEKNSVYKWYKLNPKKLLGTAQQLIVSDTGKFMVLVTDSLGCSGRDTIEIKIGTSPSVAFTYVKGAFGLVNFYTVSKGAGYLWNFGDGVTSNVQNPSHTYLKNQPFNVSLTVTDSNGCDSTLIDTFSVTNAGIEEIKEIPFTISQLPNTSYTTINYTLPSNSNFAITISDMTGREVYSYRNSNQSAGKHQLKISDAEVKDAGIYLIRFSANGTETVRKFAKVK